MIRSEETILWKKGKGGLLEWRVLCSELDGWQEGCAMMTVSSGQVWGKLTTSSQVIKKVGSSSAYERALSLASTKIKNKLETGYCRTKEEAESGSSALAEEPMPMCFLSVQPEDLETIPLPCYASIKKNGVAGVYYPKTDRLCSRKRKTLKVPHIHEQLRKLCEGRKDILLVHFEFWTPGLLVNEINSLVKRNRKESNLLLALVHDVGLVDPEATASTRLTFISDWLDKSSCPKVKPNYGEYITTYARLSDFFDKAKEAREEGIVCRYARSAYLYNNNTRRRITNAKVKPVFSKEFRVFGVSYDLEPSKIPGEEPRKLVKFICEGFTDPDTGKVVTFEAVPAWTHDKREEWYAEFVTKALAEGGRSIEKLLPLTCEYRELTTNGLPFHAVAIDFRDDI